MLTLVLRVMAVSPQGQTLVLTQEYDNMRSAGERILTSLFPFPSVGGDGILETHTTLPSK